MPGAATLEALAAIREARPAALATLLDGEYAGAKLYVDADGTAGGLGGIELLERNVAQEARGLTTQGRSLIRDYGDDGASLGRGLRVHVVAFAEPPRMVIFGAIDFASALAPLAKGLGYRVTIADPRRAFLDSPRFTAAAKSLSAARRTGACKAAWKGVGCSEQGSGPGGISSRSPSGRAAAPVRAVVSSPHPFPPAQDPHPIGVWTVAAVTALAAILAGTAAAIALTGNMPHEISLAERHALIIAIPMGVGLYAWAEGTHRRFGRLLVLAGVAWFFPALSASSDSVLYSVGRVSAWIVEAGLIYLILSFPSGRLTAPVDRALMWSVVAAVGILFLPTLFITEAFPTPSQVSTCSDCPENAFLLVGSEPAFLEALVVPLREFLVVALMIAVTLRLAYRVRHTTPLMGRTLKPVLVVAALRPVALAVALGLRRAGVGDLAVEVSAAVLSLALPAVSIAFLIGLFRWRIYTTDALVALAHSARTQDGPDMPRDLIAKTLNDSTVELAYWRPEDGGWVDAGGNTVANPWSGRCATAIFQEERPYAAVIHDCALREQRPFVEAVGAYAFVWDDNQRLAERVDKSLDELRESRARLLAAADDERRRIERDLHDGGQQRLVALRIRLELAEEMLEQSPAQTRTMLHRLGDDVDAAIDDLRSLAADVYPSLLAARGLPDAIRMAALQSPVPVSVAVNGNDRYLEEVETAAYFCCLEALQNVAKHAPEARWASVTLHRNGDLRFEVRDDGPGFVTNGPNAGRGIVNMRDRIEAVGGQIEIHSGPGAGTEIVGRIPVAPD